MSDEQPGERARVRQEFLRRIALDHARGDRRELAHYLAAFPDHAELIALEYGRVTGSDTGGDPGETERLPSSDGGGRGIGLAGSPGRIVGGRYRIEQNASGKDVVLGSGGQGVVYLAEDEILLKPVALKVLTQRDPDWARTLLAVRREALITARLEHPAICTVYDVGHDEASGTAFIAMRYVEGTTLAKTISTAREAGGDATTLHITTGDRPIGDVTSTVDTRASTSRAIPVEAVEILRILALIERTASALHAAHEQGVIHRDIKPGNIMVTKDGQPVILDFGLAKDTESDLPTMTQSGDFFGTPAYMSPEQLLAQRIKLDRRTDVWSLGVTLFECLALERPFDAPTRDGLYHAILQKEPPDLRRLNPGVSRDLRTVVATAIEKNRDRRYQTADAFAADLRRVRLHEPILARPAGPLLRLWRWAERNPALAAVTGGLIVALTAGLVVSLYLLALKDEALTGKQAALEMVTREQATTKIALDEKAATLADYDRLGALATLQRLTKEADALWPAEQEKIPGINRWLGEATRLAQKLPDLEDTLARLRRAPNVDPYSEADRADDLARHVAESEQLAKLRTDRAAVDGAIRAAEPSPESDAESVPATRPRVHLPPADLAELRARRAALDSSIAALDATLHERLTWRFNGATKEADQFKHDALARIVSDLKAFADPDPRKGILANVQNRLSFARSVEQETIAKYRAQWQTAIAAIAAEPKYHGLRIKEQLGLIPIGPDPESALWEFAHLQTTTPGVDPIPQRDERKRLIITADTGLIFVLLPGGTFRMGAQRLDPTDETMAPSDPNVDPDARPEELPINEVTLDAFFMSKFEMTQGQWLRVTGKNPSSYTTGTYFGAGLTDPVEQVSWEDCAGAPGWLTRLRLRLPTEAQWEYAARGGTTTPRWCGLDPAALARVGNVADLALRAAGGAQVVEPWDDHFAAHARVGALDPNPFGLHDVMGNVWEWCLDWLGGNYLLPPDPHDGLRHSEVTLFRITRGGSFNSPASYARSSYRSDYTPTYRSDDVGVRPARSVTLP